MNNRASNARRISILQRTATEVRNHRVLVKLLSLLLEKIKKLSWNGKILMRYAFHVLFCFKHCLRFCLAFSLPKARITGLSCLCIFTLGHILTLYL